MAGILCIRSLRQGRCLVLLFGYVLGIVLGCAITLTFDFREAEPASAVNVKRELVPLASEDEDHSHTPSQHRLNQHNGLKRHSHHPSASEQYHLKNYLLVAIAPSEDIRDNLNSMVHTWGQTVSKLALFVSKDTNVPDFQDTGQRTQVVRLFDSPSSNPADVFRVIRYLYDNHRMGFKWFLIADKHVYINVYALHEIGDNAGPRDVVYAGYTGGPDAGEPSRPDQYCRGEAGVLLSQEALVRLGSRLTECEKWRDVPPNGAALEWDALLGRCVNETLGLACFKIFSRHFVVDKLRASRSPDNLWKPDSAFAKALTVYPVVSSEHMYTLHYFFASGELKKAIDHVTLFNGLVSESCQELPQTALANEIVQNDCSAVLPDDTEDKQELAAKAIIKQRVPYHHFRPATKFQYQHWRYFDPFYLYSDDTIEPYVSVKAYKYYSLELKRALQEAVRVVSKRHHPSRMKFKYLHNGYVRHDPLQGNEYIIDAVFADRRKPRKTYNERVRLLRPLSAGYVLQSAKNDLTEKVHIVVPISDVTQRCYEFLSMFANVSFATNEATHLVLVVYGENDIKSVEEKVESYRQTYPGVEISVVKGEGEFSRSKALDQGMKSLEKSDLAFFCDVDMTIERSFLNRCRRNTVEGKMVYYPEVFKLYNPKFTGSNHNRKISRKQGHWVNYGYGMVCIYKSDYDNIGGLNTGMLGWGGEDVDFFEKVLKSKMEILQSPETGLLHRWHPNVCSQDTTDKFRESCVNSRAEVLGDKSELAKYIYDLMEKHPDLVL